ncbi:tetratricopeptide repeat protein [Nocardia asiatica]|uniref:tetratricopeptide repeat protein n=1 Tax=Nocardia asiatica TaxID=209252 RepID=UPI002454636E|nr:tetratricopeptide repeat protein [Nocardia asiatica]
MTEGVTGHQEDSARARFAAELAALRGRSAVTADDISDWIRHRKSRTVAPSTIGDWLKPQPTIPRTDEKFLLVVECLYAAVSEQWTIAACERWKQWRAAAYAESRLGTQQTREAGPGSAVAESGDAGEDGGGSASVVVGLVPQESAHFVDREQFRDLDEGLAPGRVAVVVTGMRGAGKTQLAAAYARQVLDHERGLVGWVNAETVDTLFTGLAEIADHLGVAAPDGDPVKSAHRLRDHLNNHPDRHLLVLDNATDPDQLRVVLPTRGGTRVVVTTTNQAMTRLADVTVDAGTGYTADQAHTYLREATGILDDPGGEQALAEELGCLPLALAAAAAAITTARPPLTYETYLQRLRTQPLPRALRRRDGADHPLRADQAILVSITAAEAATDDPDLDTVVHWLLGLFAVLAPSGVRRELLHHPDPELDELVDEAIDRCTQHSPLNWSTEADRLLAHRLTARVLLERARDADTGNELLTRVLNVLQPHLFDEGQAWAQRVEGADLVDQIEAIWASDLPVRATPELCGRAVNVRFWATRQLIKTASLNRAISIAEQSRDYCERVLGGDHLDTLNSFSKLAYAYNSAGRVGEAIALYERTLPGRERALGTDHPDTLASRSSLASAYRRVGRIGEAIRLFEQTFADRERVLGTDHPDTLVSRSKLASAYRSVGRISEAIRLYEQNLADRERVLGTDHPDTLSSRNNLAFSYASVDRMGDAITLYQRTLVDRERILGADHPDTLTSRNNLGCAYNSAGRVDEAIAMHERTLADRERVFGPDYPRTLRSRTNLALAYESAGRVKESIMLHERTLADRERVLGPNHPDTSVSLNHLARLRDLHRFDD